MSGCGGAPPPAPGPDSERSTGVADPAQPPGPRARPISGTLAAPQDPSAPWSFLVGGHLYGAPTTVSAVPSPTLLANIHMLRAEPDAFIVSLGDFVRALEPVMTVPTEEVFRFIDKPVFNAPGNHDWRPGRYEAMFGPSYGALRRGPALLVFINTELARWQIEGEQLEFLRDVTAWCERTPEVRHVFVFGHKVVFAAGRPDYAPLFDNCNGRDGWSGTSNFVTDVLPLVHRIAARASVHWFAGDVGVAWSGALFYAREPGHDVQWIATGLGATPRDHLIRVCVDTDDVRLEIVPLVAGATEAVGEPVGQDLRAYGPEFWAASIGSNSAARNR